MKKILYFLFVSLLLTMNLLASKAVPTKLKITMDNKSYTVTITDGSAIKDLVAQLPLTVKIKDYNDTEKIADLPKKLSTKGEPSGYQPKVGDLSYYAPWGNLSIFYKDFRYSDSLIKLGTFDSGIEDMRKAPDDTEIKIELQD